ETPPREAELELLGGEQREARDAIRPAHVVGEPRVELGIVEVPVLRQVAEAVARRLVLLGVVHHDAELRVDTRADVEVPPLVQKVSLRGRSGPEDGEAEHQPTGPGPHGGAYRMIPKPLSSFGARPGAGD